MARSRTHGEAADSTAEIIGWGSLDAISPASAPVILLGATDKALVVPAARLAAETIGQGGHVLWLTTDAFASPLAWVATDELRLNAETSRTWPLPARTAVSPFVSHALATLFPENDEAGTDAPLQFRSLNVVMGVHEAGMEAVFRLAARFGLLADTSRVPALIVADRYMDEMAEERLSLMNEILCEHARKPRGRVLITTSRARAMERTQPGAALLASGRPIVAGSLPPSLWPSAWEAAGNLDDGSVWAADLLHRTGALAWKPFLSPSPFDVPVDGVRAINIDEEGA